MRSPTCSLLSALALGAAIPSAGCATRDRTDAVPPAADSASVALARSAANDLGPDLVAMLMGEIRRGGPVGAIAVCADSAQLRTARHGAEGVAIRRIGTRLRNPDNAPDSLEARILAYLGERHAAGEMPAEVIEVARTGPEGGWELRYLRPIALQEFCTTCHGARESLPQDVRGVLATRYPADEAVGYAAGELRGAISVRVAMDAQH